MQLKIINRGTNICTSCANLIQNYYSFRLKVINSDESFSNTTINKNDIKPEDSSPSYSNPNEKLDNNISSPETIDKFEDTSDLPPVGAEETFATTIKTKEKMVLSKEVRCKLCDNEFLNRISLKNHKCPIFECPTCLDRFDTQKDLNAHLKTHPKSKKLFCKYCKRWVNYPRASLIVHLRVNIRPKAHLV